MFPDSEIASQFTLGKTRARYTMLYGIDPEFKKQLIYDINASPFYTVSFDESLNSQVQMSQMDVGVRYWNNRKNIAETHYFDSKFMRQPNADVLLKNLDESISSLNRRQFLQLAMDGPQVNWNVLKLLDDKLVSENLCKTVNIEVVHSMSCTACRSKLERSLQNSTLTKSWNQCSGCSKVSLLGAMSASRKAFLESFLSGNNSIYTSQSW